MQMLTFQLFSELLSDVVSNAKLYCMFTILILLYYLACMSHRSSQKSKCLLKLICSKVDAFQAQYDAQKLLATIKLLNVIF